MRALSPKGTSRLPSLHTMCRRVLRLDDTLEQLTAVCEEIQQQCGFSRTVIFLVDEVLARVNGAAGTGLPLSYIHGLSFPLLRRRGPQIGRAIARCVLTGETILCRDRSADPGFEAARAGRMPGFTFAKAYACIPLRARARTFAVIVVSVIEGEGELTDESVAAMESFADFIALAILQAKELAERKRLDKELHEVTERVQRRLGQDFHDGLGQDMTGLRMMAELLEERLRDEGSPHASEVQKLIDLAARASARARELARGLYPVTLERHGIVAALKELAEHARQFQNISCTIVTRGASPRLDTIRSIQLYRIAQEAVHNAVKHGRARRIAIGFRKERGRGILTVKDDGRGGANDEPHARGSMGCGMETMRHRAKLINADLKIESDAARGTIVTCSFVAESSGERCATHSGAQQANRTERANRAKRVQSK